MTVTDEQAEEAFGAHRASMASALLLELTLIRLAEQLEAAGVEFRVLKGTAVAHLDYPEPSLRAFGDIDLLVRSSQFDRAIDTLTRAGHQRKFPEPRPGFDRRFSKGSCVVTPEGHEIDVHRTFAMGPFGMTVDLGDLWARSSTFQLAGRSLSALGPEERFLHACFHAALGEAVPRLTTLRDIAQMRTSGDLDLDRVSALSAAWKADAVTARALSLTADVLQLEPDDLLRWARERTPTRRERRALAVYADPGQTYAAKSFAAVRAIPRWRDRAAFVLTLAFPRRRYLEQRQEKALRRWRRGLAQVARSLRRR